MMKDINIKIEYMDINELTPYINNAKLHPDEQIDQIVASIKEFGFNDPIAIDKNNVIIEGHGRLLACKKAGIKTVPVIRLDHLTFQFLIGKVKTSFPVFIETNNPMFQFLIGKVKTQRWQWLDHLQSFVSIPHR